MDILQLAHEHYWDTLEPQKELVIKHLEGIVSIPCEWTVTSNYEDAYWDTSCGEAFVFEEGTPEDNSMKYCPFCGRKLTMRAADPPERWDDDEEEESAGG